MGLFSKKTKSTSNVNQNTTMTTNPLNPDWVTKPFEDLSGRISSTFAGLNPTDLVAGSNPLLNMGFGGAADLGSHPGYGAGVKSFGGPAGTSPLETGAMAPKVRSDGGFRSVGDPFSDAENLALGAGTAGANTYDPATGQAANALDYVPGFENKYLGSVVDTSLGGFDRSADRTRAQQKLDLANDQTFGGSSGSLLRSLTEGELSHSRGELESGLRFGALDRAFGLAGDQANRQQGMTLANMGAKNAAGQFNAAQQEAALGRRFTAADTLAGTEALRGGEARANVGAQIGGGDIMRQIEQAFRNAPAGALGLESSLLSGLPLDLFHGTTANGTMTGNSVTKGKTSGATLGDWLAYLSNNAQAVATAGGG